MTEKRQKLPEKSNISTLDLRGSEKLQTQMQGQIRKAMMGSQLAKGHQGPDHQDICADVSWDVMERKTLEYRMTTG